MRDYLSSRTTGVKDPGTEIGFVEAEVKDRVVYIVSLGEAVDLLEGIMPRESRGPFPSFDV